MSQLDSKVWKSLLNAHNQSRAVERRGLRHIHDPATLDELSLHLANYLAALSIRAVVRTESVWIDGTPQAKFVTQNGLVQCELADLLVLLTEVKNQSITRRAAVLIQAKVGTAVDRIPSGSSTKKERALLEEVDLSHPIELYRDTQGKKQIGSYQLNTSGIGLKNYARYMVMPTQFHNTFFQTFEPFVTGWPQKTSSNILSSLALFKDLPIALWEMKVGKPLLTSIDEWTRLVENLLGQYRFKRMRRFGGFDRVAGSSEYASFTISTTQRLQRSHRLFTNDLLDGSGDPPDDFPSDDFVDRNDPPALPVISFVIDLTE